MEAWIPITFASAFLQNLRSAAQKHLKSVMGTTGATFVRFGFGLPFALLFVALLHWGAGDPLPEPNLRFAVWVLTAAATQIAATFLLVHLFAFRNFVVGTAYSRTEPMQAALFALVFLGETVTFPALVAIVMSVAGVMLISIAHTPLQARALAGSLLARSALVGLASGTCFGIAAVAVRAASLSIGGTSVLMQAGYTLAAVIVLQTVAMLAWMLAREAGEIVRIGRAWRTSLFVGLVGSTASFGWFVAMTLQQAAIVKAVAQVEMVFTLASSVYFFKEHVNRVELAGCALIVGGILVLLLR